MSNVHEVKRGATELSVSLIHLEKIHPRWLVSADGISKAVAKVSVLNT